MLPGPEKVGRGQAAVGTRAICITNQEDQGLHVLDVQTKVTDFCRRRPAAAKSILPNRIYPDSVPKGPFPILKECTKNDRLAR